jgi:hypothetical protein
MTWPTLRVSEKVFLASAKTGLRGKVGWLLGWLAYYLRALRLLSFLLRDFAARRSNLEPVKLNMRAEERR